MTKYFHGKSKTGPYFEGWYFKCQTGDGHSLALIPAVHISANGERSASLQLIAEDGAHWLEYPGNAFSAKEDFLDIRLGDCRFSEEGLSVGVEENDFSLHGSLRFGPFQRLESDIMGPFQRLKNMECVHTVISMQHSLQGQLELNGRLLDFSSGTGYIEGDRGRSFPTAYLWTQCTWERGSLMLSVAKVPLGRLRFTGCICSIIFNGREHRIATYRGAVIKAWSPEGAVLLQGKYRLEIQLNRQRKLPLRAPSAGRMSRTVHESLCSGVRYTLWHGRTLLFDHEDTQASYEYAET